MTARELRKMLNDRYGFDSEWPATLVVDHNTYANVCQDILERLSINQYMYWDTITDGVQMPDRKIVGVAVGTVRKGIIFHNVELILPREDIYESK